MENSLPAAVFALTMVAPAAHAAKNMIVCRDANGEAYFTDVRCPAETTREGTRRVPQAQTYNGRQSIDTDLSQEGPGGVGREAPRRRQRRIAAESLFCATNMDGCRTRDCEIRQ